MTFKFKKDYYKSKTKTKNIYGNIAFISKSDDEEGIKFWIQCYKEKKEADGECE